MSRDIIRPLLARVVWWLTLLLSRWSNEAYDEKDDFDWTRHAGSTWSTGTGPSVDHTYGNSSGMHEDSSYKTILSPFPIQLSPPLLYL